MQALNAIPISLDEIEKGCKEVQKNGAQNWCNELIW